MIESHHQAHPAAATLDRISAWHPLLDVAWGRPSDGGWIAAAALAAPHAPKRDEIMERIVAALGTRDRHLGTMTWWTAYTWQVLVAAVGSYLAERRVPDLDPERVWLRWDAAGNSTGVRIDSEQIAVLPDDPAADDPYAVVVPDLDALRVRLLEQITRRYIPPMLDVLAAQSPLGKRALWAAVADRCAGTVLMVRDAGVAGIDCRAEATALVAHAPLCGKTGVVAIRSNEREDLFVERGSCCYTYKRPGQPYCATCPLLPQQERTRRLQAIVAEQQV